MDEIVGYELFKVPPRWLFLKIETKEGLVGWGEPIVEGRADTVRAAVEELMDAYLIGRDPLAIEDNWQLLYRGGFYRGGPILMSAIGGIDQALWDIKGKHYDAPVYELLGGKVRDRVRLYQKITTPDTENLIELAEAAVEDNFTAIKLYLASSTGYIESKSEIDRICDRVATARDAVGPNIDIAIDLHGRISAPMVRKVCSRLDKFDPLFIEEPVRPERVLSVNDEQWAFEAPLALGERLYSRWDFRTHIEHTPMTIAQPDPSHAGGISEVAKIADIADMNGIGVALNTSVGPIASAACLQVSAYAANTIIQPAPETQYSNNYVTNPAVLDHRDGFINVTSEPGLGISIDEEAVAARAGHETNWHNPTWRHDDGSLAEW